MMRLRDPFDVDSEVVSVLLLMSYFVLFVAAIVGLIVVVAVLGWPWAPLVLLAPPAYVVWRWGVRR